jgi:hypothetical protein
MASIFKRYGRSISFLSQRWHAVDMRLRRLDLVARRLQELGYPRGAALRLSAGGTLLYLDAGSVMCT